jgi:hypothetical protein
MTEPSMEAALLALVDKIRGGTRDGWGYSRDECAEFIRLAAPREALIEISQLTTALRQGGPDPMDLQGLSEALEHATNLAHDALAALPQPREAEPVAKSEDK